MGEEFTVKVILAGDEWKNNGKIEFSNMTSDVCGAFPFQDAGRVPR